jgi:hypothetical protein
MGITKVVKSCAIRKRTTKEGKDFYNLEIRGDDVSNCVSTINKDFYLVEIFLTDVSK